MRFMEISKGERPDVPVYMYIRGQKGYNDVMVMKWKKKSTVVGILLCNLSSDMVFYCDGM